MRIAYTIRTTTARAPLFATVDHDVATASPPARRGKRVISGRNGRRRPMDRLPGNRRRQVVCHRSSDGTGMKLLSPSITNVPCPLRQEIAWFRQQGIAYISAVPSGDGRAGGDR